MIKTIRGKRLAVDIEGNGEPVLMIHGLGGTTNVWGVQAQALARRFTTIRIDLEGSGRSPPAGTLSIEGWVEDLHALVQAEGLTSVRLVAHSLGTLIAQHFAARYPEQVVRLALLGINRAPVDARRQTLRSRADHVRADGLEAIVDSVIEGGLSKETRRSNPMVEAFVRELLLRQSSEGYARCCEAVATSTAADIGKIRCPVLLIAGAEDAVSTPAISKTVAAELTDAQVLVLDGCGHWLPLERPAETTQALLDFL
jgi:3-oxoadipate enol-lactonase